MEKNRRAVTVGEKTTTYTYYANGNRSRSIYPGGTMEHYTYDKKNQIKRLTNKKANDTLIFGYSYTYGGGRKP